MEDRIQRMRELVSILRQAGKTYYQENREIMSNFKYDKLYGELNSSEQGTGIVMSGSPTQKVGYEVLNELSKETHDSPMLSLDKTKSVEGLQAWLGAQEGLLSWRMDDSAIVLTYEGGGLQKAVTRGNGETREVITANTKIFSNIPLSISYKGQLVLRGEAVITYPSFRRVSEEVEGMDAEYKNPRSLCSGSVRQLNNQITAEWNIHFEAFALVRTEGVDFDNSRRRRFEWLREQRFEVVAFTKVAAESLPEAVKEFADVVESNDVPSDDLVLTYDDIAYGESLRRTAKLPRSSITFRWQGEIQETRLDYIEWSVSRTGLVNPVAVFNLVRLEGTTVSRVGVHNLNIMEGLELGVDDIIIAYKASMIIPQITDNLTRSGVKDIPGECPVCGGGTQIKQINDVKNLYCINPDCQAKRIKSFTLFVSRDALNIDGFSEATLEKFIGAGFIHKYADIFHLDQYRGVIMRMDGFGQKSYDNLIASIQTAPDTTLPRLAYGLGIAEIGLANAKMLYREFKFDFKKMHHTQAEELVAMGGIEDVLAQARMNYFSSRKDNQSMNHLLKELTIELEQAGTGEAVFEGMTFVITGSAEHFANRKKLQEVIKSKGSKTIGSVTTGTTYLINNDAASNSSKNKKAKKLGVLIISEEEFLRTLQHSFSRHADGGNDYSNTLVGSSDKSLYAAAVGLPTNLCCL